MSISDISNLASANLGSGQMDTISGASSYVPATTTSPTESLLAQMRSAIKQNSQDFKALKTALNSNDPTGASQAFTTLQQDIEKATSTAGGVSPFDPNSPIGKDFKAIGGALQSGDLATAKQAFASFKQDIKQAGRAARAQNAQTTSGANDGDSDDRGPSGSTATANSSAIGSRFDAVA
jgi:hypothetical protein